MNCPYCGSKDTRSRIEYGDWISTCPLTGYRDYQEFEISECQSCGSTWDPNEEIPEAPTKEGVAA